MLGSMLGAELLLGHCYAIAKVFCIDFALPAHCFYDHCIVIEKLYFSINQNSVLDSHYLSDVG